MDDLGSTTNLERWLSAFLLLLFVGLSLLYGQLSDGFLECDDISHYMMSRFSFAHPDYLLDVWGRPLMTLLYALPARFGPQAARVLTSLLGGVAAYLAYRAARGELQRVPPLWACLAIVLTFSAPMFFLLSYSLLTEVLFSTVLIGAALSYQRGWYHYSALLVSLSPMARPEGFFIGVLWGLLFLFDPVIARARECENRPDSKARQRVLSWLSTRPPVLGRYRRLGLIALLPLGTLLWNFCGFLADGEVLWLVEHWPWSAESKYGSGDWWRFFTKLPLMVIPYFSPFFVVGVVVLLRRRRFLFPLVAGYVVLLHTALWTFGLFGSAGYTRYLVTIVPILAVCTTVGLASCYAFLARLWPRDRAPRQTLVVAGISALSLVLLLSSYNFVTPVPKHFDFIVIEHVATWFNDYSREHPDVRIASAHPNLYFAGDIDSRERGFGMNEKDLRAAPVGDLAFWETQFANPYSHITPEKLRSWGYVPLDKQTICDWESIRTLPRTSKEGFDMGLADFDWDVYQKTAGY